MFIAAIRDELKIVIEHPYDKFPIIKICGFVNQKFVMYARSEVTSRRWAVRNQWLENMTGVV